MTNSLQHDASMIYIELPDKAGPVEAKEELTGFISALADILEVNADFLNSLMYSADPHEDALACAWELVMGARQHPASPVVTIPHFGRGPSFTGDPLFYFLYG